MTPILTKIFHTKCEILLNQLYKSWTPYLHLNKQLQHSVRKSMWNAYKPINESTAFGSVRNIIKLIHVKNVNPFSQSHSIQ